MSTVSLREIAIDGLPASVHVGGQGEPLLLVHGGWGGASMHWSAVWERFAERFQVIAPDLPGVGRTDTPGLGSLGAYARWLDRLLDALGAPSAWCVGNSFGAAVVSCFATQHAARCRGVVFVNGAPLPALPQIVGWLLSRPVPRQMLRALVRKQAFNPSILRRAFADPGRAPAALRDDLERGSSPQMDAVLDALLHGGPRAPLGLNPLIVWGEADRLAGSTARDARKLHDALPGSQLTFIPATGHMPQLENPEAFVDAVSRFIEARSAAARPRGLGGRADAA
ncbi:alpha/beta fold hydrolase [Sorangium sp. So ce1335]|uniref:alpha/beta fold hydrolase n=1 Tax=Sorangium sp. So ce1335 TaxID=3133335 RepID=UPI003F637103